MTNSASDPATWLDCRHPAHVPAAGRLGTTGALPCSPSLGPGQSLETPVDSADALGVCMPRWARPAGAECGIHACPSGISPSQSTTCEDCTAGTGCRRGMDEARDVSVAVTPTDSSLTTEYPSAGPEAFLPNRANFVQVYWRQYDTGVQRYAGRKSFRTALRPEWGQAEHLGNRGGRNPRSRNDRAPKGDQRGHDDYARIGPGRRSRLGVIKLHPFTRSSTR